MHHPGASDVAEFVSVAVQEQEGPVDGWDLPLDACRRPHELHAERHPHAAVEVQLICVICLHLAAEREREKGKSYGLVHHISPFDEGLFLSSFFCCSDLFV